MSILGLSLQAMAEPHTVALLPFITDQSDWHKITEARDLGAAVQAELSNISGIEWVERAQLGLLEAEQDMVAAFGGTDLTRKIQLARWKNAQWLVTGRIQSSGEKREMILEVIDAAHADILVEKHLTFPGSADRTSRFLSAELPTVTVALREAFEEACAIEAAVAGQPTVAVLFFPDSEEFQREFNAALRSAHTEGQGVRVLKFPRAAESFEESEMLFGGFTEDTDGRWQGFADVYVWGTMTARETGSIDGEVITDAHTPTITIHVWNGEGSPQRFEDSGEPVSRREFSDAVAAQARRLAARVCESVTRRDESSFDELERKKLGVALLQSAEHREKQKSHRAGYLHEPEGRRHYFNQIQTLEAACFFDPQNREARETLLRLRWSRRVEIAVRSEFRFQIDRSKAWGDYVERFGLPPEIRAQPLIRGAGRDAFPIASEYLGSSIEVAWLFARGNPKDAGYPAGVPESITSSWSNALREEVARRTLRTLGRKDVDSAKGLRCVMGSRAPDLFYLRNPKVRLEVLRSVWPTLSDEFRGKVVFDRHNELREDIERTYGALGMAGKEKVLFASVNTPEDTSGGVEVASPAPARPAGKEVADWFSLPPIAALPPRIEVGAERFDSVAGAGLYRVHRLALLGGGIWFLGEGLEAADLPAAGGESVSGNLAPTSVERTRLFRLDAATGEVERIEAAMPFEPVDIMANSGKLWLALGKDGVACLDPDGGSFRRFGPDDNLSVTSAYRLAALGDRICVTANLADLFLFNPSAQRWEQIDTEFPEPKLPEFASESRTLAGFGSSLLLCKGSIALRNFDTKAGWTRVEQDLTPPNSGQKFPYLGPSFDSRNLGRMFIEHAIATPEGFWLGEAAGLHFLKPGIAETKSYFRPLNSMVGKNAPLSTRVDDLISRRVRLDEFRAKTEGTAHPLRPTSRIPGRIIALAADGDFLWVASTKPDSISGGSYLMVLHTPTKRWIACALVDRVSTLAVDDQHVWIGNRLSYGIGKRCMQRFEKNLFYDIPESQWVSDRVGNAEGDAIYAGLDAKQRALWHFIGGDYTHAAEILQQIMPRTAESAFLLGLCYDSNGLDQADKSRAFFEEIARIDPSSPLIETVSKFRSRK